VEVERARVTRLLAGILEHSTTPKIAEAATTLCELQVETYGSMYFLKGILIADYRSRAEKTDFLLEQVRLCIEANDWVTAENMGRKISTRWFDSKDEEETVTDEDTDAPHFNKVDLKLRFASLKSFKLNKKILRLNDPSFIT